MKITFIVESYYPKMSGVPNVVKYLAEGLAKNPKNIVSVITRLIDETKKKEIYNNVNIFRFKVERNIFRIYTNDCEEYIKFIESRNDDITIIECCQAITTDILLPIIQNIKGKVILHAHGFSGLTLPLFRNNGNIKNTIGNTYNFIFWNLYYKFHLPKYINDFDATISLCENDSSIKYLKKHFKNKMYILGNAADNMFFSKNICNLEKYIDIKNKYFLSVSNYLSVKNQMGILKEYYLSDSSKKIDMIFIGSSKTDYYYKLLNYNKKLEKKYGKRKVYFLTNIKREEIPGIMKDSFLYLVGSTYEEYSISIIETMSQGIPFVSTDVGNAKLLPGGITISKIKEMHLIIDNLVKDKKLYNELSIKGINFSSENCQINQAVGNLERYINEIVKGNINED